MNPEIVKFMNEFTTKIPDSEIYLVGGAVRNKLMGIPAKDYDFATSARIDAIEEQFACIPIGKSKDFGIIAVHYEGGIYEVAHYRSDSSYSDSRHPDTVNFDVTIENDSERRDFTMNAMYQSSDGEIIDFHNGQQDIKDGIIRSVGDPIVRIREDYLRILRAIRFSAVYDFTIEDGLKNVIRSHFKGIDTISQERITGEIISVASKSGKVFYKYLKLVEELGGMKYLFPEIEVMKDFKQYYLHHPEGCTMKDVETDVITPLRLKDIEIGTHTVFECGTVYDHQMAVMQCIPDDADVFVVLGALYHDIGKPIASEVKDCEFDTYSFKRHEYLGVKLFDDIAKKRKIGGGLRESIKYCISEHMNMNNHDLSKKSTIINMALSPFFDTLIQVSRADDESRNIGDNEVYSKDEFDRNLQKFLDARDNYIDENLFKAKVSKFIDGEKVMELLNVKPSRKVGEVISEVTQYLIENDFKVSIEDVDAMIIGLK